MTLKEIRKANGKTQTEVAAYLKMSQNGYSMIETGVRKLSVETAKLLARLYHINWWELFQ